MWQKTIDSYEYDVSHEDRSTLVHSVAAAFFGTLLLYLYMGRFSVASSTPTIRSQRQKVTSTVHGLLKPFFAHTYAQVGDNSYIFITLLNMVILRK